MKQFQPHRSTVGDVSANLIAVLCYLLMLIFWTFGLVPVLIIFLVEKRSGLVRYHSVQAMLLWLLRSLLGGDIAFEGLAAAMTGSASYLENPMGWGGDMPMIITRVVISGLMVVLMVVCAVSAYGWRLGGVPLLGQLARFICKHSAPAAYSGTGPVPEDCRIQPRGPYVAPVQAPPVPDAPAAEEPVPETPPPVVKPKKAVDLSHTRPINLQETGTLDIGLLMAGLDVVNQVDAQQQKGKQGAGKKGTAKKGGAKKPAEKKPEPAKQAADKPKAEAEPTAPPDAITKPEAPPEASKPTAAVPGKAKDDANAPQPPQEKPAEPKPQADKTPPGAAGNKRKPKGKGRKAKAKGAPPEKQPALVNDPSRSLPPGMRDGPPPSDMQ